MSLVWPVLNSLARLANSIFPFHSLCGCGVCATITPFLNSPHLGLQSAPPWAASPASSGRSCPGSFNSAKKRPSGRGGHPTTVIHLLVRYDHALQNRIRIKRSTHTGTCSHGNTHFGSGICSIHASALAPSLASPFRPRSLGPPGAAKAGTLPLQLAYQSAKSLKHHLMAQHASPNVSGQIALLRAQLKT